MAQRLRDGHGACATKRGKVLDCWDTEEPAEVLISEFPHYVETYWIHLLLTTNQEGGKKKVARATFILPAFYCAQFDRTAYVNKASRKNPVGRIEHADFGCSPLLSSRRRRC